MLVPIKAGTMLSEAKEATLEDGPGVGTQAGQGMSDEGTRPPVTDQGPSKSSWESAGP